MLSEIRILSFRYGHLVEKGITFPDDRECCAAVLNKTFGDSSSLYQIGISKVMESDAILVSEGPVVLLNRKLADIAHRKTAESSGKLHWQLVYP